MAEADPRPVPDPKSGAEEYQNLAFYEAYRARELGEMLKPFIALTDEFGSAVARIVWVAGQVQPKSVQDRVVRDLLADTFDFMWAWRNAILSGKETVPYPLARRAYESLSLLSVCVQDPEVAARWEKGAEIGNAEIRTRLAELPLSESRDALSKVYRFFSKGSHPNRSLVGARFLGEGNAFVLGSIGTPDLVLVLDHCLRMVDLWYWLLGVAAYAFRDNVDKLDPGFPAAYRAVSGAAPKVIEWLTEKFNHLLADRQRASG